MNITWLLGIGQAKSESLTAAAQTSAPLGRALARTPQPEGFRRRRKELFDRLAV